MVRIGGVLDAEQKAEPYHPQKRVHAGSAYHGANDEELNTVVVARTVLGARDSPFLLVEDRPLRIGPHQLSRSEIIDHLAFLNIDLPVGEDHVGVETAGAGQRLKAREEASALAPRHIVDGPTGVNQTERAAEGQARHVSDMPADPDSARISEPPGLGDPSVRGLYPYHLEALRGKKNAIPPLTTAKIENVSPARKESRHLTGKGRRLGPPDVRLWGTTIFAGPRTAHALLRELEEEPGPA
jgi:hypothetical protein